MSKEWDKEKIKEAIEHYEEIRGMLDNQLNEIEDPETRLFIVSESGTDLGGE